jgi:nicotinate-nucleotide pyrophosphorylase (carboxylating)
MDAATLDLIDRALAEDVGPGDVTTEATVDPAARARATVVQKAPGVIYGLEVAAGVFTRLDPEARSARGPEGEWHEAGARVLTVEGSARALLTGERTALNFLGRLSGVATLTAKVVRAVEEAGGEARILDTRKTTPGLRALEKAAVAAGGGVNHRFGLWDAVLIKENHIAAAGGIAEAVRRANAATAQRPRPRPPIPTRFGDGGGVPIEVEVRNPAEIDEALAAGAPALLLDNMTPEEIRAAVEQVAGRATLEVSGAVTPETVLVYATIKGVDYVSMGALTHSAPVLDLSLSLESLP